MEVELAASASGEPIAPLVLYCLLGLDHLRSVRGVVHWHRSTRTVHLDNEHHLPDTIQSFGSELLARACNWASGRGKDQFIRSRMIFSSR
jgi:hypothetical protein